MAAPPPLDWINHVETSLAKLDEKPQFGLPINLDWKKLEDEFRTLFSHPQLKISQQIKGWIDPSQAFAGMGGKLLPLAIEWTPLNSPAFFVADQQSLKELMSHIFASEDAANYFFDSSYVQGFYHYFTAEILRVLERQQFASPLTPRLGPKADDIREIIGEEACFAIDVSLQLDHRTFWGRILLTESFRKEWKTYFAHLAPPSLSEEMKEKLLVYISLEIAHTRLKFEDWKKVKSGDFIVLDHCSYDPDEHKGSVVLTLNQKPIFRGRFKDGGIKITNYPLYEEVSDAMEDDEPLSKHFDTDDDEDLYGDLDEDEDSTFDEDEDDIFAGLEPRREPSKVKETTEQQTLKQPKIPTQLEPSDEGPAITPDELPVHLTVEVGKIKMTAAALMNLAPGNLLELNVSPEQGVDLVINGKKVGKGELIRIGDVLGVRILSL